MNINNIIKEIELNNGCNIDASGDIKTVSEGFMVSLANFEKIIDIDNNISNTLLDAINKEIKAINKLKILNHKSNFYVGLWKNKNKIYIDISINILNKNKAIQQGIKNNQFCIYDIKNNCDIELKQNTYIIYQYNKLKNDFIYLHEFLSKKQAMEFLGISKNQFYSCLVDTIENYNISKLYHNKFCIVKDKVFYRDLV